MEGENSVAMTLRDTGHVSLSVFVASFILELF